MQPHYVHAPTGFVPLAMVSTHCFKLGYGIYAVKGKFLFSGCEFYASQLGLALVVVGRLQKWEHFPLYCRHDNG